MGAMRLVKIVQGAFDILEDGCSPVSQFLNCGGILTQVEFGTN
jgi:hypothetical protein